MSLISYIIVFSQQDLRTSQITAQLISLNCPIDHRKIKPQKHNKTKLPQPNIKMNDTCSSSGPSSSANIESIHSYLNASQGDVELDFPVASTEQPEIMLESEYWDSYPPGMFEQFEGYHWMFLQDEIDSVYRNIYAPVLLLPSETDTEPSIQGDGESLDGHDLGDLEDSEWDGYPAIVIQPDDYYLWPTDFEDADFEEDNSVSLRRWAPNFVALLERVSTHDIPADKMMCPICWVDFGETNEFHELYEPPELPSDPTEAENMLAFRGLPFDLSRPNNDAVRLPCRHLFGLDCIADNLTTSSLCPMCRAEFRLD
jgi:hypothetical protein